MLKELVKLDKEWVPRDEGASLYIRPFVIGNESRLGVKDADLVWKVRGKEQRILPAPIVIEEHEFGRLPSELLSVRAADADYSVRGEWSPPTLQTELRYAPPQGQVFRALLAPGPSRGP